MRYHLGILATAVMFTSACDYNKPEDYDAKKDYRAYQAAQKAAQEAAGASATPADPEAEKMALAMKNYKLYCASCHGNDGAANSPTANALNPKPRDFTDKAWQSKVDDAHIHKVIKDGGPAVGLSPTMAPWGASLKDADIDGIVKVIRDFAK